MDFDALIGQSLWESVETCHSGAPVSDSTYFDKLTPNCSVMKEDLALDTLLSEFNSFNQWSDWGAVQKCPAS